jgi:hypothetical protein
MPSARACSGTNHPVDRGQDYLVDALDEVHASSRPMALTRGVGPHSAQRSSAGAQLGFIADFERVY